MNRAVVKRVPRLVWAWVNSTERMCVRVCVCVCVCVRARACACDAPSSATPLCVASHGRLQVQHAHAHAWILAHTNTRTHARLFMHTRRHACTHTQTTRTRYGHRGPFLIGHPTLSSGILRAVKPTAERDKNISTFGSVSESQHTQQ